MYLDELADAVERGIALLDKRAPSWLRRVNVERLEMLDARMCVLGQVFGSYAEGVAFMLREHGHIDPTSYGFSDRRIIWGGGLRSGPELTELWQRRIRELQHERSQQAGLAKNGSSQPTRPL